MNANIASGISPSKAELKFSLNSEWVEVGSGNSALGENQTVDKQVQTEIINVAFDDLPSSNKEKVIAYDKAVRNLDECIKIYKEVSFM